MKRAYVGLCILLVALDQTIKALIRQRPNGSVFFEIPHVVSIVHRRNTGAAFSLLAGRTTLITLVSVALMTLLVWLFLRTMRISKEGKLALAVLIGGGIGNLIDRIAFGSVTDYIRLSFIDFPVFNFADILITVSIGALLLLTLMGRLEERG